MDDTSIKAHGSASLLSPLTWRDATAPDLAAGRTTGRLRSCSYCGSMHPADLAAAIGAGARGHWADFKYGWPHKFYVEDVPNPHAGMLESRMSPSHAVPLCPRTGEACTHGDQSFYRPECDCMRAGEPTEGRFGERRVIALPDGFSRSTGKPEFRWHEEGKPADATTHGKFYTEHLQDATPDDREVIERAMGLRFNFSELPRISWSPFA